VWGNEQEAVEQRKQKRAATFDTDLAELPKPYTFFEVLTDGSTVPSYYNKEYYPTQNYYINTIDIHRAPLWQKPTGQAIVSNADDEAAQKMRHKFGLK